MMFLLWPFHRRKAATQVWKRESTVPRIAAATFAGRRHVTGVPYTLPKDVSEVNRLDFQHYIYRSVLKGNFLAPIFQPQAILDVAAGTGIWGKEVAQQFQRTRVIGLDLEDIKASGPLPHNYEFVRGNLLEKLPFPDGSFDFVHQRLVLASAVPVTQWVSVINELLRVTRLGGWIELPEVGVEVNPLGPLTKQFFQWGIDASVSRGLDPREIPNIRRYLAEASGVNIGSRYHDVPMGAWGGRLGIMMQTNMTSALRGLKALYLEKGANEDEFNTLLDLLPDEWADHKSCMRFFVFLCQK